LTDVNSNKNICLEDSAGPSMVRSGPGALLIQQKWKVPWLPQCAIFKRCI